MDAPTTHLRAAKHFVLESSLVVVPWLDPVVDTNGFPVLSRYVEHYWLPVLGPSALWILRRIVIGFEEFPGGYEIDVAQLASAVGLSFTTGANSPFTRSLERCIMFGAAQPLQGGLAVRQQLPVLSNRQLQRLPPALRRAHPQAMAQSSP
jgi:hypothetical protein